MLRTLFTIVFISLVLWSSPVLAEIYQCQHSSGLVEYTDEPCHDTSESRILDTGDRLTDGGPGLRSYELERLRQLDRDLMLERLARLEARARLAGLTADDEVQCRGALLYLDDFGYRYASGYASRGSRFLRELWDSQIYKRNRYCR